jgi:hypothetical protein
MKDESNFLKNINHVYGLNIPKREGEVTSR